MLKAVLAPERISSTVTWSIIGAPWPPCSGLTATVLKPCS